MSTLQRDPREQVQVLDEDGRVLDGAEVPDVPDEDLVGIDGGTLAIFEFELQRVGEDGCSHELLHHDV